MRLASKALTATATCLLLALCSVGPSAGEERENKPDDFKATTPGELKGAISEAFAADGPAIVDAIVAANELPNFPHIELETVGHYAMAKIKEALLAVTGA